MMRIEFINSLILVFSLHVSLLAQSSSPMKKSYLALGDSYTIGESVPLEQNWPHQLHQKFEELDVILEPLKIIATTGWTTDELLSALVKETPDKDYDLVSLLIGVNNQYRDYDTAVYRLEFTELLEKAISYAGSQTNQVFVVSIPDYGVTPFGVNRGSEKIAREIDLYNSMAEQICEEYQVKFIDITPISLKALEDPKMTASDQLHPSALMYSLWTDKIFSQVKDLFIP